MAHSTVLAFYLIATGLTYGFNGDSFELECPDECDCHYFRINWVTDCSESNLTEVPYDELSLSVYILDLNGNNITSLKPFPGDIKMRRLQIANNRLTRVDKEAFKGLEYLIDVDLSGNNISYVDPDAFLVEAHFKHDSTELCIGECYDHDGLMLCTANWFGYEEPCVKTQNRTLRYRTKENVECVSNCANFGYSYQWCAISSSKWGKCSRRLALVGKRTHATTNKYKTCADACEKRGSSYTWCHVVGNTWYRCDPDDITHTFDYTTVSGKTCVTRCSLDSSGTPQCYNEAKLYETCYLNPSYTDELNFINSNLHTHCPFSVYEDSNSLRLCGRWNTKSTRASDDEDENELYFNCDEDVETVAESHAANNPTITLRRVDHTNIITTDTNPILSYTVLPTISNFTAVPMPVDLPLVVRALLTSHTMAPLSVRDAFTRRVDANYNGLDRNLQHINYDERGHILASRLGGPMETFNVFPQSWRMNRGRGSLWYGLETDLDNFLRKRPSRHVFFIAVLSYATDDNHILVHRPTAVMLRVRAYDNGNMVHLDGSPVTSIRPNVLENVYFSNNPDHSCAPLPGTTSKPHN